MHLPEFSHDKQFSSEKQLLHSPFVRLNPSLHSIHVDVQVIQLAIESQIERFLGAISGFSFFLIRGSCRVRSSV